MSKATAYMQRFLDDVKWTYNGVAYQVRVDRYLNTKVPRFKGAKAAWQAIAEALPPEFVVGVDKKEHTPKLRSSFRIDGASFPFDGQEIRNTFHGKASPDTIAKTLWLAMHYGLILGPSPARPPKTSTVSPRSPQQFAHDCLGTDCSGFVNLFHGRESGQYEIKNYDLSPMGRRKEAREIHPGDVLVATSYSHIAIVERVQPYPNGDSQVYIVESYGYEGEGVTAQHPRTIRMESAPDRKFIQVRHDKKDPAHYYFVPPIVHGEPVP